MATQNRSQVVQSVIEIIAEQCSQQPDQISETSRLDAVGADSLDRVEIVITLEETFNIEISDEAADKIETVKGYVDCIMEQMSS